MNPAFSSLSPLDPSNYLTDISPSSLGEPPGLSRVHAHSQHSYESSQILTPSGRRHDLPDAVRDFVRDSRVSDKESLRGILNQFEKTQLVEMLCSSSFMSDEVREAVSQVVASSTTFRRLLVRNIPFQATSDHVKNLFGNLFGGVEEGAVVYDRATGRSKGFAFLTFESVLAACNAVCASNREEISMDGRFIYLKFAADRLDHDSGVITSPVSPTNMVKLFVYNLSPLTTNESLRAVFGLYGELDECSVVFDPQGRSKRFAFVTFSKEEDAWRCLQEPNRTIDGRMTFTHLACEGRNKTPRSSTAATGSRTPRHLPTTPQEASSVFTPPSATQGLLMGQEILSHWLNELSQETASTQISAEAQQLLDSFNAELAKADQC